MGAAIIKVMSKVMGKAAGDRKKALMTPANTKLMSVARTDMRNGVLIAQLRVGNLVVIILAAIVPIALPAQLIDKRVYTLPSKPMILL